MIKSMYYNDKSKIDPFNQVHDFRQKTQRIIFGNKTVSSYRNRGIIRTIMRLSITDLVKTRIDYTKRMIKQTKISI